MHERRDPPWTDLPPELRERQAAAVELGRSLPAADMIERDREGRFDREAWRRCAESGVQGLVVPVRYGGSAATLSATLAVLEGLGYGAADHGLLFSLQAHLWAVTLPVVLFGSSAQKATFLPAMCAGDCIGAHAATEIDAGSDVFALATRAERSGGGYVLRGRKILCTNAPIADLLLVYATIDPALGPMGVTAFLVERTRPGVSIGPPTSKLGLRTSPMAEVTLDGCAVPAEARLGREGRGAEVFAAAMESERGAILASCLGVMRRQLERCVEFARSRRQFGSPIGKFQAVANRLVDMKLRYETSRALVYRFGRLKDEGRQVASAAALAKLHVSESFVASSLDAIAIFGGAGYTTGAEVERDLRDAVGTLFSSGTSDIQRLLVAKGLGL